MRIAQLIVLGVTAAYCATGAAQNATDVPWDGVTTAPAALFKSEDEEKLSTATTPSTPPRIGKDAAEVLEQMAKAYEGLETLEVTGTLATDYEIGGRVERTEKTFSGAFQQPNLFRHQLDEELTAGFTGEEFYLLNQKTGEYMLERGPTAGRTLRDMPEAVVSALQTQNPSLLLLFATDPLQALGLNVVQVERGEDVKVEGKQYTALVLILGERRGSMVFLVDKENSLLRRVILDLKAGLERAGIAAVRKAFHTVDYTRTRSRAEFETGYFNWTPPAAGRRISPPSEEESATTATPPVTDEAASSPTVLPTP